MIGDHKDGGLKNVDIETKLKTLKLTWVRRLGDDNHHPWKIIPLNYLTLPNRDLILHRNFACNPHITAKLNFLPAFYKDLLNHWWEISHCEVAYIQVILSESLWYNSFAQINQNDIFFRELCLAGIKRVADLLEKKRWKTSHVSRAAKCHTFCMIVTHFQRKSSCQAFKEKCHAIKSFHR